MGVLRVLRSWTQASGAAAAGIGAPFSHHARSTNGCSPLSPERLQTPFLRQVSVEGARYLRPMHYYHLLRHPAGLALVGGLAALDLVSRALLRRPDGAGI